MHFTYVIIPALSLLNMGVEGATIAKALTSRHSSEAQQVRGNVHGRQFRNADFDSPVAQATRHSIRSELVDNAANKTASSIKGPNGLEQNAAINPEFADYVEDSVSKDGAQDKTFSDSTTGFLNTDKLLSLPVVGTDPFPLSGLAPLLSSSLNTDALVPLTGDVLSGVLPGRREDDDNDQVQEVVKELESVSTSSTNPSTLEGNSVTPQAFDRRFLRKRDDGSLVASVGEEPVLQVQRIPTDSVPGEASRGMNIQPPINIPRDHKLSHLETREDIANFGVKALNSTLDQSEDIENSSG